MARKREFKFAELGKLLTEWREQNHRSAVQFNKAGKFSFSYSKYADFERGQALPTPEELVEIARFIKKDAFDAIRVWVKVQMPTEELAQRIPELEAVDAHTHGSEDPADLAPPTMDNTWVLGPTELSLLKTNPEIWDLFLCLSMDYPKEVSFKELGMSSAAELLKPWIKTGHLIASKTGVRMKYRHVHLPRSEEWNQIRIGNLKRALHAVTKEIGVEDLATGRAYRELIHRSFSPADALKWTKRLRKLEEDFKAAPYREEKKVSHCLLMVFGPRTLVSGAK
jgi:hypothetical protein